jgi:hypothetical protein
MHYQNGNNRLKEHYYIVRVKSHKSSYMRLYIAGDTNIIRVLNIIEKAGIPFEREDLTRYIIINKQYKQRLVNCIQEYTPSGINFYQSQSSL